MIVPDEEFFRHPIINPRYLSKNYPEFFEYLKSRYTDISSISEALYMWRHNILKRPVCPICGSNVKFQGITKGYSLYCSYKCSNSSEIKKAKVKNTCTQKYGVSNPNQNREILNKVIKKCLFVIGDYFFCFLCHTLFLSSFFLFAHYFLRNYRAFELFL